jgi:hypothetical protein
MTRIEAELGAGASTDLSPGPVEVLIPEVRQRTRRRRARNLVVVLALAAVLAAVIVFIGSASPTAGRRSGSGSPTSPASTGTKAPEVVPEKPVSLAVGSNGELYIADFAGQRILRRLPSGHFEVVAGTGVAGYSGDRGRAVQAEIDSPASLAIAPSGAIYFVQSGRSNDSVVREIEPNGDITTVVGQDPNCAAVRSNANLLPAKFAELSGGTLTIGTDGLLDISTTVCPNILRTEGFFQLTASGELHRTWTDEIPDTAGYCGDGVAGTGFVAFGCMSGAGLGPRLMVARSNGTTESYPDDVSEPNFMSSDGRSVLAIHNRAIVRLGADSLETLATQNQIANLVSRTALVMGDGGIAVDHLGDVYFDQDFLIPHSGCSSAIFEINWRGQMRKLWRSASMRSCY